MRENPRKEKKITKEGGEKGRLGGENQVRVATCTTGPTVAFHVVTYCWLGAGFRKYVE